MIAPNTNIRLLKVPFEIAKKNQLTFSNLAAQTAYFLSLPHLEYDDTTYQRQNETIRFAAPIDTIRTYNYVMYKNESYSDKWFYAYVTGMTYKNDEVTDISIQLDVFQTWQFDIVYNRMFVEREHVNDDTIGKHTIPENLDVGEIKAEATEIINIDNTNFIAVATTYILKTLELESGSIQYPGGRVVATGSESTQPVNAMLGNVVGTDVILFPFTSSGLTSLRLFVLGVNVAGHIADISNMYILPIHVDSSHTITQDTFNVKIPASSVDIDIPFWRYSESFDSIKLSKTLAMATTSFSDISVVNNKCKVYPYNYLFVSNNVGNQNILKIEDFSNVNSIQFDYEFTCSVGGSARLVPKNYKGITRNLDESIPLAKFPTCSWSADAFINWLTQNAVNIPTQLISAALSPASSIVPIQDLKETMKIGSKASLGLGMTSNVASTIGGVIGEFYSASLLPQIQGGQSTGDVNFASSDNDFIIYRMRAKKEYLQVIDNFFSMFGYKVNEVKVPNVTGRTNWNYVKTIDCNIVGEIPQEDLQELKNMFDNGVTFWHNPSTFLDYSQSNTIVS